MKRAEILTGLWLLMFLIYGKECMSQIQNKVCDTIPYELVHNKIIIPVTINGVKTKYAPYRPGPPPAAAAHTDPAGKA